MTARHTTAAALTALMLAAQAFASGFVNKPFPDFSATDAITGEPVKLGDLRGRVVLVDFWATWCAPCRDELPHLKQLWNDYHDQGLAIIGISLDSSEARLKGYVQQNGMDWHHVFDGGSWRSRFVAEYRVRSIPRLFVIGPDGICLAETNRVGRVEALIRKTLSDVDPSTPGVDLWRLREVEARLASIAEPLRNYEQSLGLLERITGDLDRQLRNSGSVEGLDRRYRYLLHQLTVARRELFMMGLLAQVPELPGDPFYDADVSDAEMPDRVAAQLRAARAALVPLREAVGRGLEQIDPLLRELHGLGVAAPGADPDSWIARLDAVEDAAEALAAALAEGPRAAIERLDRRLADYVRAADEQVRRLEGMCVRVSELQTELAAAADGSLDPAALRDRIAALTASVNEIAAAHGIDTSLPADPFEGRGDLDVALAVDVAAHLQAVDGAATRLDAAVVAHRAKLADLALQTRALLDGGTDHVAEATVKRQIDALTDRMLALATGS